MMENPMDYEHRRKIPMATWKTEEQNERKDPSHIYDSRGKVDDNKRRRIYICIKTEKKERERWTYDKEEEYITETITSHWKSLEIVEIKKSVCSPLVKLYKKSFLYERRPLLTLKNRKNFFLKKQLQIWIPPPRLLFAQVL
jgi:hypothetical protein